MKQMTFKLTLLFIGAMVACTALAQDKKEMKQLEQDYAAFTGHKKVFDHDQWSMCKFSVVYKLTSSMVAADMEKNSDFKVKSSSGAYAMLNGISEEDLQRITDKVGETFIQRMKEEAGVTINTWSSFKDNEHTDKLKESAEDREQYSKSQGLAYAMSYDQTPHYNRVIALVPDGKKLAKSLDGAVAELTLVVDFADMIASADADIKYKGFNTYTLTEKAAQRMVPLVRVTPKIGSQATWEAATDIQGTSVKAHDEYGYMFSVGLPFDVVSEVNYVESVKKNEGTLPTILANRRNNKVEYVTTWDVNTNATLYEKAVLDAVNQYLDTVIKIYTYHKN